MNFLELLKNTFKKTEATPVTPEQEYQQNAEKRFDVLFEIVENSEGVQSVKLKNDNDRVISLDGFPERLENAAQRYDQRAEYPVSLPTLGEKPEYPEMSDPEDDRASAALYREFARIADERIQSQNLSKEKLKAA